MILIISIITMVFFGVLGYKKPALALITSPIAVIALIFVSVVNEQTEGIVAALFIFLVTLIAILMSRRDPNSEQIPQRIAKWILITLFFLFLFASGFALLGPLGILGLGFVILLVGFVINFALISRYAVAAYILSTIGSSMRQNLPLAMALDSAASGQTDDRARILRRIKKWLVQGYSLSESIKRGYPKCPSRAIAMIAAAEKINQLPLAIKAIEANIVAKADENRRIRPIHPLYPVIVISFTFIVLLGLMKYVVPKFVTVLEEMIEGQLPVSTRYILGIADYVAYRIGPFIWLAIAFIVLVVIPLSIRIRFRPRRPDKPYLISQIGDFVKWHLPILRWFERNYSMLQAVELLRLSLSAGCTVNEAIANTLGLDVNSCFKKRLRKWLLKVEAGNDIADSAKKSKLGRSLAWAFDGKINQGNTLTILETLESFHRSNYSYRVNLARFILWPCVTIAMGAMVGFVAYAIFSPMVAIIHHLADTAMP